jgi:glucose/arabinose dehydrogenase
MGSELTDLSVIFEVTPNKKGGGHFGGRMAFLDDGTLLLSVGEGYTLREDAQKKESQLGKLLRMTETGEAPPDNPFTDAPFVYSYGHRNPQGLIVDAPTQTIWMTEHGPKGGDELNQITAGKNYGWPAITYGVDYSGAIISPFTEAPGMEQPVTYWVPSIATSGLALYTSDAMPELKGKLLVGGLKSKNVVAVDVSGDEALVSEPFPGFEGRIRDVRMLNDGSIAVIDEEAGKVVRISAGAD